MQVSILGLEQGKTTAEDVQKLAKRFGGTEYEARSYYTDDNGNQKARFDPCLGEGQSYSIDVNPPMTLIRAVQAFPTLQKLGLHPWLVAVTINLRERKVSCFSERVMFIRPDEHVIEGYAEVKERNTENLIAEEPYEVRSFVSRRIYHETSAIVLTEATTEQKRRVFQMDLACIKSRPGCSFPCQIIPKAWLDSVHERQAHGRELPEGAGDSHCPAH